MSDGGQPTHRPFPKCFDGVRELIDKELVKEQYMQSKHFTWDDFCKEFEYDRKNRAYFPFRSWRELKLQLEVELTDESLVQQQATVREKILKGRLEFPDKWSEESENTLQLVRAVESRLVMDHNWDMEHKKDITENPKLARFKPRIHEISALAHTKYTLMKLHQASLLMEGKDIYKAVIPIKDPDPEATQAFTEGERLRGMGYRLIGGGAVDHQSLTHLYKTWFDQEKDTVNQTSDAEEDPDNAPLTPLDLDDDTP